MNIPILKPCPFCGSEVQITETTVGTPYNNGKCVDYSATIECSCGLSFEKEWTICNSHPKISIRDVDIYTAWNKRVK